jgi:Flp pilus assembly protein TadD
MLGAVIVCGALAFVSPGGQHRDEPGAERARRRVYAKAASNAGRATWWAQWAAWSWSLLGQAQAGLGRNRDAVKSLRHAVANDPTNHRYWIALAAVAEGREGIHPIRQTVILNPRFHL